MDFDKKLWNLMAKKLAGESTAMELQELDRMLQKNPDAEYYMQVLKSWWVMTEKGGPASGVAFEKMLARFDEREKLSMERTGLRRLCSGFIMIPFLLFVHLLILLKSYF